MGRRRERRREDAEHEQDHESEEAAADRVALLHFFRRRDTRAFDDEVEGLETELSEFHRALCAVTSGTWPSAQVRDLVGHGIADAEEAKLHMVPDANGNVRAMTPLPSLLPAERELDYAGEDDGCEEGEGLRAPCWAVAALIVGLVAMAAAAAGGVAAGLLPGVELDMGAVGGSTGECSAAVIGERLADAVARLELIDGVGDVGTRGSFAAAVNTFGEAWAHDYSDEDNLEDPPRFAVSLRMQGTDSARLRLLFEGFLQDWLGAACASAHVRFFNLSSAKQLHSRVNDFLVDAKAADDNGLALVVLSDCASARTSKLAMGFKDHLGQPHIPVRDARTVPARGVGFVFLGGSMPSASCEDTTVQAHDEQALGWKPNVNGRISFRGKLCS